MAPSPNSPINSSYKNLFVSTEEVYKEQREQLEKEAQAKQEAIEKLQEISKQLFVHAGQLNATTEEAQRFLLEPSIQNILPTHGLSPTRCRDPEKQFKKVLSIAQLAQEGEAFQRLDKHITDLNRECGKIKAQSRELEDNVRDLDFLIEKMRKLIEERKKTLEIAQGISQSMNATLNAE